MRKYCYLILILFLCAPGTLPGSRAQIGGLSFYSDHLYRFDLGNGTRLIIEGPQNGTPVAANQSLSFTIVLFNPQTNPKTAISVYKQNIEIARFTVEDLQKLDLLVDTKINTLFEIEFKDQNGKIIRKLCYPVILDQPSLWSNKDWYEAWKELTERKEHREEQQISVLDNAISLVKAALTTMIISIVSIIIAFTVKKSTKLISTFNALNGSIMVIFSFIIMALIIRLTSTSSLEYEEDVYNYLMNLARLVIYLFTFLLVYVIAYHSIPLESQIFRTTDPKGKIEKDYETATYFNHQGDLCWAKQDGLSALSRLFFNRHVKVELQSETATIDPMGWKAFFDVQGEKYDLVLCESLRFEEIESREEDNETGESESKPSLKKRIKHTTNYKVVIDPVSGHDFNSKQYITDCDAFKKVNAAYEEKDGDLRQERAARTKFAAVIASKMLHELFGITIGERVREQIEKIKSEIERAGRVVSKEKK